jgi:phytoene/squalene synthetase
VSGESNNRQFCRELAFSADPLFRISHSFSDREVSDRLVALYAFFAAVDETTSKISDEDIAIRKITWWKNEVESILVGEGSHPIGKELQRSGAAGLLPPDRIARFFISATTRLEANPPAGMEELEAICLDTGMPRLQLELSICNVEPADEQVLFGMAVRRGIYALICSNPDATGNNSFWWIPSNLLARHGVSRRDLASMEHADGLRLMGAEILAENSFREYRRKTKITDISIKKQYIKHFLSYNSLLDKKLQYTNKNSYVLMRDSWEKPRLRDLLTCWRTARKVSPWK